MNCKQCSEKVMLDLVWNGALQLQIKTINGRTIDITNNHFLNVKEYTRREGGKNIITGFSTDKFDLNLGDSFYVRGIPYKVWNIERPSKNTFRLFFSKLSKSAYLIFPMLDGNKDDFLWSLYFMNLYTKIEGHDEEGIFLHYRYSDNNRFKDFEAKVVTLPGYRTHVDIDKYHVIYQFDVPTAFQREYDLFMKGKYSKFSDEYKKRILDFHKTDEMARQLGTTVENTKIYGILHKSKILKEEIEQRIGTSLHESEEVYSIPYDNEETFYEKYKILEPLSEQRTDISV